MHRIFWMLDKEQVDFHLPIWIPCMIDKTLNQCGKKGTSSTHHIVIIEVIVDEVQRASVCHVFAVQLIQDTVQGEIMGDLHQCTPLLLSSARAIHDTQPFQSRNSSLAKLHLKSTQHDELLCVIHANKLAVSSCK